MNSLSLRERTATLEQAWNDQWKNLLRGQVQFTIDVSKSAE